MKPYWGRTGWYAASVLVSFLIGLLVVDFGCGMLLRSAIPAAPIVWRIVEVVLDLMISVGVTLFFAIRDGYDKRFSSVKMDVQCGLLFLLMQLLIATPLGTIYVTGHLPYTVASLIYFGNASIFAETVESVSPMLLLLCMVAAVPLVYMPVMMLGTRLGARQYRQEIEELKEDHQRRQG